MSDSDQARWFSSNPKPSKPILHSDILVNGGDQIRQLKPGEAVNIEDVDGTTNNLLYDEFKLDRKSGRFAFSYNAATCILTVTDQRAVPEKRHDVIEDLDEV